MKRDMEIIRQVLLQTEAKPNAVGAAPISIAGVSDETISYHVMLLSQAGYVDGLDVSSGAGHSWWAMNLTWSGHDFLDAARSDSVWKTVISKVKATGLSLGIDAIKALLIVEVRHQAQKHGLQLP